ncbi:MAG: SDR family NAD(P)-dependent oxidoreductase, partial [bacterium]|nr:SDR family NAD(P)-dependent oxidoreductase [bacterium]
PLRAGVSSFGIGGTNVHVVIEEAPEPGKSSAGRAFQLILLSAKTESAIDNITGNLARYLEQHPQISLADVAYTLQLGRKPLPYRRMLVCKYTANAVELLSAPAGEKTPTAVAKSENRPVVFMFPGQGAQYVDMGRELYRTESTFREEMERYFAILEPITSANLKEILYPPQEETLGEEQLKNTEMTQPIIFIFEYALAKLLMKWGILPWAMIGHSVGEYVAACLSGVFSLEDAIQLVALRGKLMQEMPSGAMLSVPLPADKLKPLLQGDVSLAAVNSSTLCTVSGTHCAIDTFAKQLKEKGYESRHLHTSHAFHSEMMEPILEPFADHLRRRVKLGEPGIPYLSNVTAQWITGMQTTDPGYWTKHIRNTVCFADGIKELFKKENALFLEIGPGRSLSTFVRKHEDRKKGHQSINLIKHPQEDDSDISVLLNKIGRLWLSGVQADWKTFYQEEKRHRIPLPTYPFERKPYRLEAVYRNLKPGMLSGILDRVSPDPLAEKKELADWFYIPSWERSVLLPTGEKKTPETPYYLAFLDETGLGAKLVTRLEQEGKKCITVKAGTAYEKTGDLEYTIKPGEEPHYRKLFKALKDSKQLPARILHLWGLTGSDAKTLAGTPGTPEGQTVAGRLERAQQMGLFCLLNIARAIGSEGITEKIQLLTVTDNMRKVTGDELLYPEKATALGAVKIIPLEYANLGCRSIDILLPAPGGNEEDKLLERLSVECSADTTDKIVAYRGNHRWVETIKPVKLDDSITGNLPFKEKGVYLITGGFGGMGFKIAEHLAKHFNPRLILLGRSPFPPPTEWDSWLINNEKDDPLCRKIRKIKEMETYGASIMTFTADVSDYERMREVITEAGEAFGDIDGVIHAAGVIDEAGVIQRRTPEMTEKSMASKVNGTLVLEEIVRGMKPGFLALFSSVGNVMYVDKYGQVGYNAANEFLEAFADYMSSRNNIHTVAVNWGDWREVGMSVKAIQRKYDINLDGVTHETLFNKKTVSYDDSGSFIRIGDKKIDERQYEAFLKEGLAPHEGIETFLRIMASGLERVSVSKVDLVAKLKKSTLVEARESRKDKAITVEKEPGELFKRPDLSAEFIAPQNEIEERVAKIWQEFLGIEAVGIHDDFFELGGDSLQVITVASVIHRELNVKVPVPAFFSGPTVRKLSRYIYSHTGKNLYRAIETAENKNYYPLSTAQKRLYILHRIEPESISYNQPRTVVLEEGIDGEKLNDLLLQLIERHESLRTAFLMIKEEPVQKIYPAHEITFEIEHFEVPASQVQEQYKKFVRPFETDTPPLMRTGLIKIADGHQHIIIIDLHHIISDGISNGLFMEELMTLYRGETLPDLKLQYKDYSEWQNSEKEKEAIKKQGTYFLEIFKGEKPVLNLPTDYPRPPFQTYNGSTIAFELEKKETVALRNFTRERGTTLYMSLLTLYYLFISKITNQEDIIVGTPVSGRKHFGLERIIGMFVNTVALRSFPTGEKTFDQFAGEVSEGAIKAFENQEYPFEDLVENLSLTRDTGRNPLFDVMFVYETLVGASKEDAYDDVPAFNLKHYEY